MDRQQDIVGVLCEVLEHKRQVAEGVRSHRRAAIIAPDEAGEAANAQRMRIAHIEGIVAPTEGSDRLSR